jgi:hypothetical protein
VSRTSRRAVRLGLVLGCALLAVGSSAGPNVAAQPAPPPDLTAELRVHETTNAHNAYPDECDQRLQSLYIAEDLELAIEVQFSRELSDEEASDVQWEVSDGAAPASGNFAGQGNPARVSTTVAADPGRGATEATVRVTYQGVDLAAPAPLRVVSDAEYEAAYASLAAVTDRSADSTTRLPLTWDLLARFLGQERTEVGTPSIGSYPLNICDPRLTQRAGANWGAETVTDVPLVEYGADQPAADVVAQGVAIALLADHTSEITRYFAANPGAPSHRFEFAHDGNLTLNLPLDAGLALHGVQFAGAVSALVDAPAAERGRLTAHEVQVTGTVGDLYDFDLEATGPGALPAIEAAKVEIASVKHDAIGKVFVVSFALDNALPAVEF